jgi:hypothetical protein
VKVAVCTTCGTASFPRRLLCPRCAGRSSEDEETTGVVEQATEREGVRIADVRTLLGPHVVTRLDPTSTP